MVKRITVMLDDDLHDKLRKMQAKKMQGTGKAVSFSKVINEIISKILKK